MKKARVINSPHEHERAIFFYEEREGAIFTHALFIEKQGTELEHFNVLLLPQNSFPQNKKIYSSMHQVRKVSDKTK